MGSVVTYVSVSSSNFEKKIAKDHNFRHREWFEDKIEEFWLRQRSDRAWAESRRVRLHAGLMYWCGEEMSDKVTLINLDSTAPTIFLARRSSMPGLRDARWETILASLSGRRKPSAPRTLRWREGQSRDGPFEMFDG